MKNTQFNCLRPSSFSSKKCFCQSGRRTLIFVITISPVKIAYDKENVGSITYLNLWLPSRFSLLYVYLAAVSVSNTLFSIGKVKKRSISTPRQRRNSSFGSKSIYSKLVRHIPTLM